jgi:hypothetical protein
MGGVGSYAELMAGTEERCAELLADAAMLGAEYRLGSLRSALMVNHDPWSKIAAYTCGGSTSKRGAPPS